MKQTRMVDMDIEVAGEVAKRSWKEERLPMVELVRGG